MSVELRFVSADFRAMSGTPTATYSLGACFANLPFVADITTLTLTQPLSAQTLETTATTNANGQFTVDIPLETTDVQVSLRILQTTTSSSATKQQSHGKTKKPKKLAAAAAPSSTVSGSVGTQFAITQTNADNYQQRSLLSVHKDNATLLSQYLMLLHANRIAIDTSGIDHTPSVLGPNITLGQQLGPLRAARALAIVQIAVMDAVIVVTGLPRRPYALTDTLFVVHPASLEAAVAQATHDTLVQLFSAQKARLDDVLADMLLSIDDGAPKRNGIAVGVRAAQAVLALRANDGSKHAEQKVGSGPNDFHIVDAPGHWAPDPISKNQVALGSRWAKLVDPFVLQSAAQFRAPPPPAFNSPEYVACYEETKAIGGDGNVTFTIRDADQTEMGIYFAYDGSFQLCAPPRLYNELLHQLAIENIDDPLQFALLLALANLALADAGLAAWDSKYFYDLWRPVTAIRAPPTSDATVSDANWTPLGAPGSNGGVWFTPPFPTYPSGHATFGAAALEVVRTLLGRDNVPLTFVSDELNGVTRGVDGALRPLAPRSFMSLSEIEQDNGYSRVLLGIHWRIDSTSGIAMGHAVAQHILATAYTAI
jgi:hypothetical protein